MWIRSLFRRGAREDPRGLPDKCFISHSYGDELARTFLLQSLPEHIEPFIFPPINATPDQMVSNELVSAILSCPGLIYLEGGKSDKSFWVAFERDYALRAGKSVYAFNPSTANFRRDSVIPPKLSVFPSFSRSDSDIADRVVAFMRDQRYFELGSYDDHFPLDANVVQAMQSQVVDTIRTGGYVIAFWSSNAAHSAYFTVELTQALEYQLAVMRGQKKIRRPQDRLVFEPRILFAALDDTPLPIVGPIGEYLNEMNRYNRAQSVNEAIAPVRLTDAQGNLDLHCADDLIVRMYWLIYRQTGRASLA